MTRISSPVNWRLNNFLWRVSCRTSSRHHSTAFAPSSKRFFAGTAGGSIASRSSLESCSVPAGRTGRSGLSSIAMLPEILPTRRKFGGSLRHALLSIRSWLHTLVRNMSDAWRQCRLRIERGSQTASIRLWPFICRTAHSSSRQTRTSTSASRRSLLSSNWAHPF